MLRPIREVDREVEMASFSSVPSGTASSEPGLDAQISEVVSESFEHIIPETVLKAAKAGQAKLVLFPVSLANEDSRVFYSARIPSKKSELEQEVATAGIITGELRAKGIDPQSSNLHLDLTKVEPGKEQFSLMDEKEGVVPFKKDAYLVSTTRAEGDLEDVFKKEKYSLNQAVDYCAQVANSVKNLHTAGYAHGDLKPDNYLFINNELRLSDFGKTIKLSPEDSVQHTGNPRYLAPERGLSQKGEVYSAALVMIRILEEPILQNKESQMLLVPPGVKEPISPQKRKGIERYVVENKQLPQFESKGFTNVIGRIGVAVAYTFHKEVKPEAEREIYFYIDALERSLVENDASKATDIRGLCHLLRDMTRSDPRQRPDMSVVLDRLKHLQL